MRALLLAAAYSVISHGVPHGDRAEIELPHGLTLLPTHDAAAAGAMFRPGPASRYGVRAVGGGGRRNRKWHFIASHYSERVICFRFVFVLYSSGIVSLCTVAASWATACPRDGARGTRNALSPTIRWWGLPVRSSE